MVELRAYQLQSIEELSKGFVKHLRQILCIPTGGGKTVVFSSIAHRSVSRSKRVLILTDRIELFKQAIEAIERLNIPVCHISAKNKHLYEEALLFVGMVETAARRLERLKKLKLDLIIIDEAHKGNFFKILDAFPEVRTIGATATPKNKKLHKYYTNIVDVINIPELIAKGFLAPCKPFQMQDDMSDLVTEGEDFSNESLSKHFKKSKLYAGVIEEYKKRANGKKAIVFNVDIDHSNDMAKEFTDAGITSYSITSKTPKAEREYLLESFKRGEFMVLNNCGILTTGYDEPTIECVIVNRATNSLPLWLQMAGRGGRPFPGKLFFLLLDFGMNHDRHGLWDEIRTWDLKPPKTRKKGASGAPVKACRKCEATIPVVAAKCNFCGEIYNIGQLVLKNGVLTEVKPIIPEQLTERNIADLNLQELFDLQKTKMYTPQLIWRIVRSKGEDAIHEYAKLSDYSAFWVQAQITELDAANSTGKGTQFNNYKIKQVYA